MPTSTSPAVPPAPAVRAAPPAAARKKVASAAGAAAGKPVTPKKPVQSLKSVKAAAPAKPAAKTEKKAAPAAQKATADKTETKARQKASKKPAKQRSKLVRDSFTMPQVDFELIAALKFRGLTLGRSIKKSELLRAGLQALAAFDDKTLTATLDKLEAVKIGRPKQGGGAD